VNAHADDEVLGRAYDHRLMRRLLGYVRPFRGQVVFAALVVALDVLAQLAGPLLTKEAIDFGIHQRDLSHLDHVAMLYLSVLLASFGFSYVHNQIMQRVGQNVMLDLRLALFRHLQRLPLAFFDRNPVGRLMTRVTNDVDVVNEFVTAGDTIFGDVFALVLIIIIMSQLNVELMLVTFSVLPLMLLFTLVFRARVRASFRDVRTRFARLNAFLNENLTGMSTVQMLNRETRNYGEFRHVNAGHRDANLQAVFYHSVFFPLLELVGALAVSLIIWYGGRQVMWGGLTLGTLVAFIQLMQRFFRPISDLTEKYNSLQQAMASSERIFDLLDTPVDPDAVEAVAASPNVAPARQNPAPTHGAPAGNGSGGMHRLPPVRPRVGCRVEFDGVWFAYDDRHWVLEDASFVVEPGEKIAIVGATGSGKTTLVSLLLRFYRPQRGEIRVDGRPLDQWDAGALRRRIGLVLQDPFLFSGTIAGNLRYGDPTLSREVIERAAREVHAHRFIERLPGGYDAEVRERGATLSAGQRQLLAFARTLVLDPAILILDEATSSVDTHTEKLIQDALRRLMNGRTSLVIAHRLSTIQDVDRIVVLHRGRIREVGTHAELLALCGIYSRLYQLQYLGARTHGALLDRGWVEAPAPHDETSLRSVVDTGLNTP
jgi:ATP-binding cassette, subfamily B, multidrug efflux pump